MSLLEKDWEIIIWAGQYSFVHSVKRFQLHWEKNVEIDKLVDLKNNDWKCPDFGGSSVLFFS